MFLIWFKMTVLLGARFKLKIQDCYIGQKVGFTYQEEVFVGVIKSLNDSIATISSNEHEDSEINVKYLLGVLRQA